MDAKAYQKAVNGQCYATSFLILETLVSEALIPRRCYCLCHGVAVLTKRPYIEFGHAWVEIKCDKLVYVIDHQFPYEVVACDTYYTVGKIRPETVCRYTLDEARKMLDEKQHYGPWHEAGDAALHAGDLEEFHAKQNTVEADQL